MWIRKVSEAEYFAVTEDYNIMRNAYQSGLIMNSRLGLFIVRYRGRGHSEKGELVVQNSEKITQIYQKEPPSFHCHNNALRGAWAQAKRQELGTKVCRNLAIYSFRRMHTVPRGVGSTVTPESY